MSQIKLKFVADGDVLASYVREEPRVSMIQGPLGSGKTQGSCYKVMRYMCTQTPNRDGVRRTRFMLFVILTKTSCLRLGKTGWSYSRH